MSGETLEPLPNGDALILKRASASRSSGQWGDDDYDVICQGAVVERVFLWPGAPAGKPWMWTLAYGHHEGRTPTHGYAKTREAAMAAFRLRAGDGNEVAGAIGLPPIAGVVSVP